MGYPTTPITDNTPGVDIYPPQNGQAMGSYSGSPGAAASPDHPTWMKRVSDEIVAIELGLLHGPLTLTNDQFAFDTGGVTPKAALLLSNAAGSQKVGIAIGQYGDNITIVKGNQTPGNIRLGIGALLEIFCSGSDFISISGSQNPGVITWNSSGYIVDLFMNATGDLIASCRGGPNAGKSVNLTFGKWA